MCAGGRMGCGWSQLVRRVKMQRKMELFASPREARLPIRSIFSCGSPDAAAVAVHKSDATPRHPSCSSHPFHSARAALSSVLRARLAHPSADNEEGDLAVD